MCVCVCFRDKKKSFQLLHIDHHSQDSCRRDSTHRYRHKKKFSISLLKKTTRKKIFVGNFFHNKLCLYTCVKPLFSYLTWFFYFVFCGLLDKIPIQKLWKTCFGKILRKSEIFLTYCFELPAKKTWHRKFMVIGLYICRILVSHSIAIFLCDFYFMRIFFSFSTNISVDTFLQVSYNL